MGFIVSHPVMAHTHCTGPGQGPGQGPGTMGFYITLCTVHTTQGQVQGTIVSYFARPGPGSMQRARAMSAILAG